MGRFSLFLRSLQSFAICQRIAEQVGRHRLNPHITAGDIALAVLFDLVNWSESFNLFRDPSQKVCEANRFGKTGKSS